MQRLTHYLSTPLMGCALAFALSANAATVEVALTAEQQRALGVTTEKVRPSGGAALRGLAALVVVPNNQQQVVAAPVAGLVRNLRAAVGEKVRHGTLLARLQSSALMQAQREFLQAQSQLDLMQGNLARDKQLIAEGIIAESRYQASRSAHAEAAAAAGQTRKALRLAGMTNAAIDRLARTHAISNTIDIVAPMDGVVIEQIATTGQRVEAFAPLYRIGRLDPLWLEVQVPVYHVAGLQPGASASVPSVDASGRVITVSRSVDMDSQTVTVRVEIDRNTARLRPGQHVEADLGLGSGGGSAWRVPKSALIHHDGKVLVFVRTAQGLRAQAVELIAEEPEGALVGGSLSAEDEVAVTGVAALKAKLMGLGGE